MNSIVQPICLSLDSESKSINQTFNQSDFLILPFSILLHHMISFHTFILGHFRTKTLKCLLPSMISHHLINHSLRNFQAQCDTTQFITTRLPNCSNLLELNQIHAQIIRSHMLEIYPPAAFYWNNIIRSYVRFNTPYVALNVYLAMSRAGVSPDRYTIPIVLKAVSQVFGVKAGRQVHSVAIRYGLELNEFVECGLISLYCKAGELETARKVFEENPERKLSSWNAIIGGLAHGGHAKEVVSMFMELKKCGFEPDDITMVSVTSACGSLGDLNLAFQLHKCVFQAKTFEKSDLLMLNSLIDMYGKCGRMDLAKKVFEGTVQRDVSTWTSLINGYAMHGCVKDALDSFGWMRKEGVKPNHVTFVGVLSACVHGGMVEEGKHYFDMMRRVYHLEPRMQHYGVMVDLLGRSGLLNEAKEMVERMPMKANAVIWGALMGACEKYGSVEMGEWVAKHLEELEPWDDGVYVVLSNIYAGAGLWNEVERVREIMKQRRISKLPAFSIL